jgi:hypothetical protein
VILWAFAIDRKYLDEMHSVGYWMFFFIIDEYNISMMILIISFCRSFLVFRVDEFFLIEAFSMFRLGVFFGLFGLDQVAI